MESIKRFLWEEAGITAVEYGIMLGLLTFLVVGAMLLLFGNIANVFSLWASWFDAMGGVTIPTSTGG